MNEEHIQQIETLIESWQLDEADLNQTDINAIQSLLKENQELKERINELSQWDVNKDTRNSRQRVANAKLLKEIKQLKKQQKKFMKWLESIKFIVIIPIEMVCDKYKEIIGDDK